MQPQSLPSDHEIYAKLAETFRNPTPITDEIDRALEATGLIAPLSDNDVAQKSHHAPQLFLKPASPSGIRRIMSDLLAYFIFPLDIFLEFTSETRPYPS